MGNKVHAWSGGDLKQALRASARWLSQHTEAINALNVFPVPDGDTGTNMSLTMQAAVKEMNGITEAEAVSGVINAAAYGALMGARGNSGVILSQLLRGMSRSLENDDELTTSVLAKALTEASNVAYKGVIKPVEGTILTVARESAEAAVEAAEKSSDLEYVLTHIVNEARNSVARTPTLLDELRQANVVDAGGQGWLTILEGMLRFLRGEVPEEIITPVTVEPAQLPAMEGGIVHRAEEMYGYDTQFILKGTNLNVAEIRDHIAQMGVSVVVVGDERNIKVHVHTPRPGDVLNYGIEMGTMIDVVVENLDQQYEDYAKTYGSTETYYEPTSAVRQDQPLPLPGSDIAIIAVAAGDGLKRVFTSIGASLVVAGGQTMNPSTEELLQAVNSVPASQVILLPNNSNIILAAQQAQQLATKEVIVIPTKTIPQGISALIALNSHSNFEENVAAMTEAVDDVQTAEITTAVRSVEIDGVAVEEGQIIGLLNGKLTIAGINPDEVVFNMLEQMEAENCEIITIYYGIDILTRDAESLAEKIRESYSEQVVEVVSGEQQHYHYIISAE